MLRKQLSPVQWFSLMVLMGGVALVQLPSASIENPSSSSGKSSHEQSPFLGFSAVVMACFLSGFSGVYFEKLLKSTPQSVYIRNVQLGVLGFILGMVVCCVKEGQAISEKGFFFGYDFMVWFTVFLLALGGLIVAAVVKYADNILKVGSADLFDLFSHSSIHAIRIFIYHQVISSHPETSAFTKITSNFVFLSGFCYKWLNNPGLLCFYGVVQLPANNHLLWWYNSSHNIPLFVQQVRHCGQQTVAFIDTNHPKVARWKVMGYSLDSSIENQLSYEGATFTIVIQW